MRALLAKIVASVTLLGALGCVPNDCKLYDTCPGDLIKLAVAELEVEGSTECDKCLDKNCRAQANECSVDFECNYTARCQLKDTPFEYQACLLELREHGYTRGEEARKPWEGTPENIFSQCLQRHCAEECGKKRFACKVASGEYRSITAVLAVSEFTNPFTDSRNGSFRRTHDARARACVDDACGAPQEEGPDGTIELEIPSDIRAESLYFELESKHGDDGDFPPTIFYPRPLGSSGPQLVAAYVVRKDAIAIGNKLLGFRPAILTDAAQSLILPDSCIWETQSARGVRVSVKEVGFDKSALLPCYEPAAACNGRTCVTPCVWYAQSNAPQRTTGRTDGTGAGAIGVSTGTYELRVEDEGGNGEFRAVGHRTVRMRAGWMTIARTWPGAP